jgi:hypothetical protein
MSSLPVWASSGEFPAAVAQLPGRTRAAASPDGAICIVDGRAWVHDVPAMIDGARAVVLTRAAAVPDAGLVALARGGVPVVVDRPRLRADDVAAVRAGDVSRPRHVIVDVLAVAEELRAAVADGVGWARVIVGGDLVVRSSATTPESLLAALEGAGGIGVSLAATRQTMPAGVAIRAYGIAETRVEVQIDDVAGIREVRYEDAAGRSLPALSYETSLRLALRRALAAVDGHDAADDAGDLLGDRRVADDLLTDWRP